MALTDDSRRPSRRYASTLAGVAHPKWGAETSIMHFRPTCSSDARGHIDFGRRVATRAVGVRTQGGLPRWQYVITTASLFQTPTGKPVVVRFNVENVLDADYWAGGAASYAPYLGAPRTFHVSLTSDF
jgi:outer membrane receptor protein involved in Fe transport